MSAYYKQNTPLYQTNRHKMKWYIFDAKGKTLGRFASEMAKILRGKHKVEYTPNADVGDGVIIINAEHIQVTGNKEAQKVYRTHSGFMGGLKETSYRRMQKEHPERILESAIRGMMPKTKLGRHMMKKLRVIKGEAHDFEAQQPIKVAL